MEIQSGVLIETVYYYGSLVENGEIPIDDVGDFTQQVFYTIDSLTPCHEYIGRVGGTIIASGGVEYFSYHDINDLINAIQTAKAMDRQTNLTHITDFKN